MKKQVRIFGFFLGAVLVVGGMVDLILQYLSGEELTWRIPILLLGAGVGLPLIIFPFTASDEMQGNLENIELTEEEINQEYLKSNGIMNSLGGSNEGPGMGGDDGGNSDVD